MTALRIPREPGRYLTIGLVCAVLNNLILIGGDLAGLHYAVSVLLTFLFVLPASYLAHTYWTFDVTLSWQAFGRYVLGSLASLAVASFVVWLLRGALALPMVVAAPLATIAMTIYNYLMARWAIRYRKITIDPAPQ